MKREELDRRDDSTALLVTLFRPDAKNAGRDEDAFRLCALRFPALQ